MASDPKPPKITFLDPESQETMDGEPIWPPRKLVADTPGRPYGGANLSISRSASMESNVGSLRKRPGSPYPHASRSDENDESLQRYKASLGLSGGKDLSDPNDDRVCIIKSLTMESPGRSPVVIDLSSPGSLETLKKTPFTIKEGAAFTMSAQFKVQHEILSGLHYVQVIKRKGIRIPGGKSDEMIGSYAPNTEQSPLYTKKFQEETAPSGWAVRGEYTVSSSFVDDDKKTHLQFDWAFEIAKDW